ncbi:MAG TPA: hypothetical protein VF229_04715, partial [Burkholderiaceae bacterium]
MSPTGRPNGESLGARRQGIPIKPGEWLAGAWIALINRTASWTAASRARLAAPLGWLAWVLVAPRRRIALANLRACFPHMPEAQRRQLARRVFRNMARGALDHG